MRLVGVLATAACLFWLTGCETLNRMTAEAPSASSAVAETTGSVAYGPVAAAPAQPEDPNDDLNLAKRHFRESNYGLAEKYFRRAVEKAPGETRRDAEAWLGLAASYDRLRRFQLADRAYAHAIKILGPTPELLNNQGYSYLLRGDYRHAREKLVAARDLDPGNPYIQNNMDLLAKSARPR